MPEESEISTLRPPAWADPIATIRRYIDVLPDIAYQKPVRKALDAIEAELQRLRRTTLSSALQVISGNRLRPEVGDPDQIGDPTDAVYNQAVRDCQVAVRALIDAPASEAPDPTESTLGHVIWHSSDEDSGPDVGISIGLGGGKTLWIGEITDDAYAEGEDEAKALGDSGGWWLMMYPDRIPFAKFTNGYEARNFADRLEALTRTKASQSPNPRDAEIEDAAVCDDATVMRLWRECGLPEYFLGNGGTNHKLVAFMDRIRSEGEVVTFSSAPKDLREIMRINNESLAEIERLREDSAELDAIKCALGIEADNGFPVNDVKILLEQNERLRALVKTMDGAMASVFPDPINILEYGPKTASLSLTFRNESDRSQAVAFIRIAARQTLDHEPAGDEPQ